MEKMIQSNEPTQPLIRALVVDDRPDVALGLTLLLRKLGCTADVAYKGQEALKKGPDLRPDVVFLDIGLPDSSGYEVCKDMRQSTWGNDTYVVAFTGRDETEDLLRAARCGFDRHVAKPMDLGTLKDILHTVRRRVTAPGAQHGVE